MLKLSMSQDVSQVTRIDVVYDTNGVVKLKCWYEDEGENSCLLSAVICSNPCSLVSVICRSMLSV